MLTELKKQLVRLFIDFWRAASRLSCLWGQNQLAAIPAPTEQEDASMIPLELRRYVGPFSDQLDTCTPLNVKKVSEMGAVYIWSALHASLLSLRTKSIGSEGSCGY